MQYNTLKQRDISKFKLDTASKRIELYFACKCVKLCAMGHWSGAERGMAAADLL